jgi:hypothetical protein
MFTLNNPVSETANFVLMTKTVANVSADPAAFGQPLTLMAQVSNGTATAGARHREHSLNVRVRENDKMAFDASGHYTRKRRSS